MFYYVYKDDGPLGVCGQSMEITKSWSKLFVSEREITNQDWKDQLGKTTTRKNPRIIDSFTDNEDYQILYHNQAIKMEWNLK